MAAFDSTRTHAPSAGLGGFAAHIYDTLVSWNERRVTRNALSRLSDRELEDIGLSRGDIDLVARQV